MQAAIDDLGPRALLAVLDECEVRTAAVRLEARLLEARDGYARWTRSQQRCESKRRRKLPRPLSPVVLVATDATEWPTLEHSTLTGRSRVFADACVRAGTQCRDFMQPSRQPPASPVSPVSTAVWVEPLTNERALRAWTLGFAFADARPPPARAMCDFYAAASGAREPASAPPAMRAPYHHCTAP